LLPASVKKFEASLMRENRKALLPTITAVLTQASNT
jgi:hypothetical protein